MAAYVDTSERALRAAVSLDGPRGLIHRFSTLVRESGSADERTAAQEIAARLSSWGVPHTVYEPLLYLSVPQRASLDVMAPKRITLRAKTPAFSWSTNGSPVRGRVVYVPSASGAPRTDSFDAALPS
ncbi:MAG TPA: peptidase M28, partial [bacterium]|nr:peptidase M28 [bacterium]